MRHDQRSAAAGTFVGRNKELAQLDAALSSAATGRGGLWLVAGEPGIGKTRLVTELAGRAAAAGARVLWGRCRELQGAPAYWPWSQVLGTYLRGARVAPADLALLARMVPGLAEDPPRDDAGPPTTGQDRFYLFDAVGRTLRTAAEDQPLVVILEDLHAADPPSLRLLQFLTAELGDAAILILATTRPTTGDGATAVLHDAVRPAQRVALSGLSRDELEDLLEWWGPSPDVVTAVWDATGGNPFFALETARLLATEGRLAELGPPGVAVPEGVRHTLRQRLAALSEDARGGGGRRRARPPLRPHGPRRLPGPATGGRRRRAGGGGRARRAGAAADRPGHLPLRARARPRDRLRRPAARPATAAARSRGGGADRPVCTWAPSAGAKGRRTTVPTTNPSQVAERPSSRRRITFWRSTEVAYRTAARSASTTPPAAPGPDSPPPETPRDMIVTPTSPTAPPTRSRAGSPSRRSVPAPRAMSSGATLMNRAAVPASMYLSAALSASW